MIKTNAEKHDIHWAVQLFRPVLIDLNIQNLANQTIVFSSNYRLLQRFHMDRCIIVVKRFHFSKDSYKGVFIWQYFKKQNVFVLYIIIADNMYGGNIKHEDEIYRKAITTHEFIHCIAAMLTSARLDDPNLIKNQFDKLKKRFHAIEDNDIKNVMTDMSISLMNPNADRLLSFPDKHFRTGDEDFEPKYSELYRNMLLSYDLFNTFFTAELKKQFKIFLDEQKNDEAGSLLSDVLLKISVRKRLDMNFVITRFSEEFIPLLQNEIRTMKI